MKNNRFMGAVLVAGLWLLLTAFVWFGPRKDISEAERRKLEQFPSLSWSTVESGTFMSKFESFIQDQFPQREGFRQLKSLFQYKILRQKDNHGIYIVDGQAAKLEYPLKESSVQSAVKKFRNIYDLYLKGHCENIVFSVVPDKGYYLADANGIPAMDYDRMFAAMEAQPWVQYVDLSDILNADDYYRTDTHWRQEAILPVAQKLTQALGAEGPGEYRMKEVPFYGVYYGQAALPMEADTMRILENDLLDKCIMTNLENNKTGSVYDWEKAEGRDPYEVFLSGSVSMLTIDNPAGEPGRELVVFRDSFGSSLIPLLVQSYSRVTVIDIRYIPTAYVGNFLTFDGQDVLFLYSTTVLNSSNLLR